MSGEFFYPPPPLPGSNAIGQFEIGVSPIGTIKPFAWQDTVISQYANSDRLMQLIANFDSYIDQTQNLDDFFDFMWNVDTAQDYGLDVWGRIVGVNRTLEVATGSFLGFAQGVPGAEPFDQAPFYAGTPATGNYNLTDSAYRTLILAKALANICDGSIPALNQILINLFKGRGNAYVTDTGSMTMTYTFKFQPTPVEEAIILQSKILPQPTGVAVSFVISP
jgi:hypothetical protein